MYNPKTIKVVNARDLNNLHPTVAYLADLLLKKANAYFNPQGYQIKVVSTLRDWSEQQKIYNQGRTTPGPIVSNAKPGNSVHNWGCAFDLGVFKDSHYLDNKVPKVAEVIHKQIAPMGKNIGLFWGGDFTSPKDNPHYQYTGSYSNSEFLAKAKAGVPIDDILDPLGELIKKLTKEGKL